MFHGRHFGSNFCYYYVTVQLPQNYLLPPAHPVKMKYSSSFVVFWFSDIPNPQPILKEIY